MVPEHLGGHLGGGYALEKDVGSKSFVVEFLVEKVEIYKFVLLDPRSTYRDLVK